MKNKVLVCIVVLAAPLFFVNAMSPQVTSFTVGTPSLATGQSVDVTFKATDTVDASLSFSCPEGVDMDIYNKNTGQLFSCLAIKRIYFLRGVKENTITIEPRRSTVSSDITFTLATSKDGIALETKTQTVHFDSTNPSINSFTVNQTGPETVDITWEASRITNANLYVSCPYPIDFTTPGSNGTMNYCAGDGKVMYFQNQKFARFTTNIKNQYYQTHLVFSFEVLNNESRVSAAKTVEIDFDPLKKDFPAPVALPTLTPIPTVVPTATPISTVAPTATPISSIPPSPTVTPVSGAVCKKITLNLTYRDTDKGNKGLVTVLQQYLNKAGYMSDEPTGYFGRVTEKAVKKFQVDHDIPATGTIGPKARAAINLEICK